MNKSKVLKTLIALLTLSLTACNGGGGGESSGGNGGGDNNSLNIQSVAIVSTSLNSGYNTNCLYEYGNYVYLVNGNGSGNGLSLNLGSGQVAAASGFPKINLATGDKCLSNYQLLTWYNAATPYQVNIFNPDTKLTTNANLINVGIAAASIDKSSFAISGDGTSIYTNNDFLNNGSFAFSQLSLPNPISYTTLNNSLYANRNTAQVLYGFNGTTGQWLQFFPADSTQSLPAAIAYVQLSSQGPIQHLSTITDSSNLPINAMTTAWDYTGAGNGVVVTTGAVQPVLYKCPLKATYSYICDKSYTGAELTNQYRILRLLGGNAKYVYFIGMDLSKADIEIFSLPL